MWNTHEYVLEWNRLCLAEFIVAIMMNKRRKKNCMFKLRISNKIAQILPIQTYFKSLVLNSANVVVLLLGFDLQKSPFDLIWFDLIFVLIVINNLTVFELTIRFQDFQLVFTSLFHKTIIFAYFNRISLSSTDLTTEKKMCIN